MTTLYDFSMASITGEPVSLGDYHGKVCLVVNVASACGLTPQYEGLQALHAEHEAAGFTVLGFPCNQFAAQEPGTDAEVCEFATSRYQVTFPLFSKIEVNGEGASPLYSWLKAEQGDGADISWNFEKFLVDRDGNVVHRFSPLVTPDQLAGDVTALL